MGSATQQRDRVRLLAPSQPQKAVEIARTIADPWFRCQALSIAAVHTPDRRDRNRAISEAFAAANELNEPNRLVTVSAWPVKALALSGDETQVQREVTRLLSVISREASPVRRVD